jgi:hypothetical protein
MSAEENKIPEMNQDSRDLLKAIQKFDERYLNGAVITHFDKETKLLKSISPMLPVQSISELYEQLRQTRDAIQHFLNDLVNKELYKN